MQLSELATPALLLDSNKLQANIQRMQAAADRLGVSLRPHLKTMKSAQAASALLDAGARGITVSTLKDARYFLDHGIRDITYAVGLLPARLPEVAQLMRAGADLKIMTDNLAVAQAIAAHEKVGGQTFKLLIEIDSGDHRGGLQADSGELLEIAEALAVDSIELLGVLTHGGHAYEVNSPEAISAVADQERDAVLLAADRLRAAGHALTTVSLGSTPTGLFAEDLSGVTELRAGVYTVFDMDQQARGVCSTDEIAMSVLTAVIGHNPSAGKILLDAGGLALSKDRSADKFRPEVGYGQVCLADGSLVSDLYVDAVSQEHGHVRVRDENDFARFPVGTQLRILPVHACMTAAAYDCFNLLEDGRISGRWGRVNGW